MQLIRADRGRVSIVWAGLNVILQSRGREWGPYSVHVSMDEREAEQLDLGLFMFLLLVHIV